MERNNNINLEEILADYARLKDKEKKEYMEERNNRERQFKADRPTTPSMRFIKETELRDQFWKKYGYRENILAYQFECPCRHGNIDLVTVENVRNKDGKDTHIEFTAFEFKLDDMAKAFSQANFNSKYCHKSFIVVPAYKEKVIREKYSDYFKMYKNIGVIVVNHPSVNNGLWKIINYSQVNRDDEIELNQAILKLCCHIY